jgi:hypothetical protein
VRLWRCAECSLQLLLSILKFQGHSWALCDWKDVSLLKKKHIEKFPAGPSQLFSFLFMTLTYICACDAWPNTWMYLAHVPGQFDTFMSKGENLYLSLYIFWEPKSQAQILCLDLHAIPLSKKWKRDRKKKHPEKIYWRMILMPLFISIVPSYYYLLAVVLGDPL